jgi:hypothetical protein
MATKVGICNQALSHLGIDKDIANLDTEQGVEARAARTFYDDTLKEVLRDFNWPFSGEIRALGLVEEDPNSEWDYSYRYPSDCLKVRRILSGSRQDTQSTREPYKIMKDAAGKLILCDRENAESEFTVFVDDPALYPPDFVHAFSLLLAVKMGPRVTAGDPFGRQEKVASLYLAMVTKAQANAASEEQPDAEADAETIQARE